MTSKVKIPTWLDEGYIERALIEGEKNKQIKVRKITVQPATSPGDNFCSDALRVTAEYEDCGGSKFKSCTKSLFVKVAPEDGPWKTSNNDDSVFPTEIVVLGKIVPALHQLLNTSYDAPVLLAAKCFSCSIKPPQTLVLEDLRESGFGMMPKQLFLDLDHCEQAVSKLAVFHAASVALQLQNPDVFSNLCKPVWAQEKMAGFCSKSFSSVAEKVSVWETDGRKYSDKVHNLGQTALQRLKNAVEVDEHGFNVLTHGDTWTNNMMFKHGENGKPLDVIFVDFQFSFYGSPVLDLLYFVYSSPTSEVRSRHIDYLLECYHSSLSKALRKLGCENTCPSLDHIRSEMDKRFFMGMFVLICLTHTITADPHHAQDRSTGPQLSEEYLNELKKLLPIFDKKGFLD